MIAIRNAAWLLAMLAITAAYSPKHANAAQRKTKQPDNRKTGVAQSSGANGQTSARLTAQGKNGKTGSSSERPEPNFYVAAPAPSQSKSSRAVTGSTAHSMVAKPGSVRHLRPTDTSGGGATWSSSASESGQQSSEKPDAIVHEGAVISQRSAKTIPDLSPTRSTSEGSGSFLRLINPARLFEREPKVVSTGYVQTGIASWYGSDFHGGPTASGERYDMESLTAAHPSLPFGTLLRVTNLHNGQDVIVRVNNRGPYVRNRILDLSKAAARQLGMVGRGVAKVKIEVLSLVEPVSEWGGKKVARQ